MAAGGPKRMFFGGREVFKKDGACYNEEGRLYGSAMTLFEGLRNVSEVLGVKVDDLISMNKKFLPKASGV